MTKHDYLDTISRTLSGRVKPSVQQETVQYYKEYIDAEIVKGTSEDMVLATLGDPRLLARTVIASQPQPYGDEAAFRNTSLEKAVRRRNMKRILILVIAVLVLLLVLGLFFSVVMKLLPILIPVGVVWYLTQSEKFPTSKR